MTKRPTEIIEWRYNLFRHKWQPDLCCAVPEHHPVPGFITGEQWDFAGVWEGATRSPALTDTRRQPTWYVAEPLSSVLDTWRSRETQDFRMSCGQRTTASGGELNSGSVLGGSWLLWF